MSRRRPVLSAPHRWLIGCVAGVFGACGATSPSPGPLVGDWGGDHVQLTVNAVNGTARFDCAHGTLDQAVIPDDHGRFDVPGTFVREHGGPVRVGETPDQHPARYTGEVHGQNLTLTATLTDQPETIGPFTLVQGAQGQLVKCL